MRHVIWMHLVGTVALIGATAIAEEDAKKEPVNQDKAPVAKAIKSYEAAFNARDAETLAATHPTQGTQI